MTRLSEPVGPQDHVIGRTHASAQLVEYLDYECPYSARAHYEVAEVLRRVGPDVLYVARHFPLTQVHPHALLAAQAAEAAASQDRFWPMHSMLFENQDGLEPEDILHYAEALGLDLDRFKHEIRTRAHLPKIQEDFRSGVRSGVRGTPTFFLDGVCVERGWDADSLTAVIVEVLHRGVARL
jgi:protein-disulfide isomerase